MDLLSIFAAHWIDLHLPIAPLQPPLQSPLLCYIPIRNPLNCPFRFCHAQSPTCILSSPVPSYLKHLASNDQGFQISKSTENAGLDVSTISLVGWKQVGLRWAQTSSLSRQQRPRSWAWESQVWEPAVQHQWFPMLQPLDDISNEVDLTKHKTYRRSFHCHAKNPAYGILSPHGDHTVCPLGKDPKTNRVPGYGRAGRSFSLGRLL